MAKLLDQLKRSEKARSDTESQLKSSQKSLSDLQHAADKHASVKEKLQVISRKKKKNMLPQNYGIFLICALTTGFSEISVKSTE